MFARIVGATAKSGKRYQLALMLTNELLPFAQTQKGFIDAVKLSSDTDPDVLVSITFWNTPLDAEMYLDTPEYRSLLTRIMPMVENVTTHMFRVDVSTFHKITAAMVA